MTACSGEIDSDSTGSSTTAPAGPVTDGCAALTQADAEAVFETAVAAPPAPLPGAESVVMQCVWTSADGAGGPQVLQFRLYEGEQFYSEAVFSDAQATDVGEQAFVAVSDNDVTLQWVRNGNTAELVYTAGLGGDPAALRSEIEALAPEIDERLG